MNLIGSMPYLTKKNLLRIAIALSHCGYPLRSFPKGGYAAIRHELMLMRRKRVIDALRNDIRGYGSTAALAALRNLKLKNPYWR
jgi:hypothetical protein